MKKKPKPPAGSGLQMQSSLGGGGGQTYFAGASPKKKGKTAAKKTPKKKVKKGSGKLAAFGVMPKGQATLPKAKKKNGAAPKKITTAKYRKMAWDAKERGNWSTAAKYYDSALKNYPKHHADSQIAVEDKAGLRRLRDEMRRNAKR